MVCIPASLSFGQSNSVDLAHADSLFQQKRYIQSFEIYQTIFERHQYTPAMLLKMAYIQEGLNQIAQSVYYLNLYYQVTQDDGALVKLNEVADKYRLEGYATSEFDSLLSLYQQHKTYITVVFFSVLIFLLSLLLVQKFRYNSKPYGTWVFLFLFSVLLITHLNIEIGRSNAIISKNNTYLMDGPSGGASVISIVRDGHRVKIKGKKDIWVKVQWGEMEAYIKENNLLRLSL
jgi:hypothetical protein